MARRHQYGPVQGQLRQRGLRFLRLHTVHQLEVRFKFTWSSSNDCFIIIALNAFSRLLPQRVKQDGRDSRRSPEEDSLQRPEFARARDPRAGITRLLHRLRAYRLRESKQLLPEQSLSAASPYRSHPGCFHTPTLVSTPASVRARPSLLWAEGQHRDWSTIACQTKHFQIRLQSINIKRNQYTIIH